MNSTVSVLWYIEATVSWWLKNPKVSGAMLYVDIILCTKIDGSPTTLSIVGGFGSNNLAKWFLIVALVKLVSECSASIVHMR